MYDFEGVSKAFGVPFSTQLKNEYENVYEIEEVTTFIDRYIVRMPQGQHVNVTDEGLRERDLSFFQKYVGSTISNVRKVSSDSDFVKILKETEYPDMTLEQFTKTKYKWIQNNIKDW